MAKITNSVSFPQEYLFYNTSSLTINHNLGYKPMVYCVVGGIMAFCDVYHTDNNQCVISFQNSISGVIYLR